MVGTSIYVNVSAKTSVIYYEKKVRKLTGKKLLLIFYVVLLTKTVLKIKSYFYRNTFILLKY